MEKDKIIRIIGVVSILSGIVLFFWSLSKMVMLTLAGKQLKLFWWHDPMQFIFFLSLVLVGVGVKFCKSFTASEEKTTQLANKSKATVIFLLFIVLIFGLALYLITDGFSNQWSSQDYWWAIKSLFSFYK